MITLYNKSETNFEHNGIGSIEQDIIDPKIHWIDNGVFSFEFDYPLFAKHGLELTNSSIIKARDPEQDNLFFVYKIIPSMGYIKVYCYHIFYKLAFNTINDTNIVGKNGQGALTQLSGATQYPHKFQLTSNLTNIANSRVVRKNPVEFLLDSNLDNSFINRWGGHIIRHGFNISMNQSYGNNKGYKIQHKKDLMGYEATIDETTVVTRIRPVGYDGLLLPEIYIDSPLINNYPEPRIQEYAYSDVKVGKGEGEFATAALAYAELRRLAKLEFSQNKIDVPRGIYKVDFVNLKETEEYKNFAPLKQILPGDIVAVEHEEDGINIRSQMVEYNWDPLLLEYIDLTLGNYEKSFTQTTSKIDKIQKDLKDINNQVELIYLSANGKNKTYTSETEPTIDQNSIEGDMWIRKNGDKTELWFLRDVNGELQWVVEISDATQEELRAAVADAVAEIASVTKSANDAVTKADQAITAAGFSQVDSTKAIADALSALNAANAAKLDASGALVKANKAISDSGTAIANAASALSRVGAVEETTGSLITSYDALTNTVGLKADKTTVNGINQTVTQQGLNISANATAVGLKADKTVVDTIKNTVASHTLSIEATADSLATKAEKTLVDSLNGTVASHTSQIKINADGLALKADSNTVNSIKGTVDTHTTLIKATSDGLLLKADSSTVNTLSGTVSTHTGQISANSTAIGLRLTSTQVESAITAKNYVNQTTLNATASGINLSIAKVSTELSNLDYDGKDLINRDTLNEGYLIVTGELRVDGSWVYTDYIPVISGDVLLVSPTYINLGSAPSTVFYNSSKVLVGSVGGASGRFEVIVPESGFVRFSFMKSSLSTIKLQKGSTGFSSNLEKFTTLEATVNGINTVVGSKANQTQVTQLAGQISTKVESSTYTSKMTQLDNAINLRVLANDVTAAILADKTIKDTRSDNQLPSWYNTNYPKQTVEEFKYRSVMGVPGSANYGKLETKVIWNNTAGGAITQIFSSSDGVYQRISNSAYTAWLAWDKLAEAGQLISQINLSTEGILLQGKRIQLDGDVTMTNAFISSIKAIDISADRITAGTLNAANVNIINLNASKISTGTISGANSGWNLNTGTMLFLNPSSGDSLYFKQGEIEFQNGSQGRYLKYQSEGLRISPFASNTGTSNNTSLHLIGGGTGSYQYIQFLSSESGGIAQRLQAEGNAMTAMHAAGGLLLVKVYGGDNYSGILRAARYETTASDGLTLEIQGDQIRTPRDGSRNLFLTPQGTGAVIAGAPGNIRYNVNASDFVKQSSRTTKTNIVPLTEGLGLINRLTPVSYNKIDKLNQGIIELEKGFISEDSFGVSTPDGKGIYDSHITAYLVKAVQELDQKVISIANIANVSNTLASRAFSEMQQLKNKVTELELKIKKLESVA